jgi:hypothetical protein
VETISAAGRVNAVESFKMVYMIDEVIEACCLYASGIAMGSYKESNNSLLGPGSTEGRAP